MRITIQDCSKEEFDQVKRYVDTVFPGAEVVGEAKSKKLEAQEEEPEEPKNVAKKTKQQSVSQPTGPISYAFALRSPPYKAIKHGRWELKNAKNPAGFTIGYFLPPGPSPETTWVLSKDKQIWMSIMPMELESQSHHANLAYGHVVVCGLGMGVLVWNLLQNPKVTKVTVLEKDKSIIKMFGVYSKGWLHDPSRLDIYNVDAAQFFSGTVIDTLLVDIWANLGDLNAEKDTRKIFKNIPAKQVGWWGQELDWIKRKSFHAQNIPLSNLVWKRLPYTRST